MRARWPLVTIEPTQEDADVLIVTSAWPGPDRPKYGIFIARQVESLRRRGTRPDVLFVRGYRSPLAYVSAAALLVLFNLSRRYRLVHAHGGEAALPARLYVRAPLLISYLGDDLLGSPRADGLVPTRRRLRSLLLRQLSRLAAATITKTSEMELVLPERVRKRNAVIPNGVDERLFTPIPRQEARGALGWDDEERVVVFAGDPSVPRKRFALADAACRTASAKLGPIRLYVASNVDPSRMPLVFSAADALLLTSFHEGSPNVVKEAMMCNLPVVSTRVGDVEERLRGVEPSSVCDSTPETLGAALVQCLAERRRSNGRRRASGLTLDAIADRVLAHYRCIGVELKALTPKDVREP
jgi:teichuronic acid biosynthesis glycosyltransferase TuaC